MFQHHLMEAAAEQEAAIIILDQVTIKAVLVAERPM
jgi:hypothetical protein